MERMVSELSSYLDLDSSQHFVYLKSKVNVENGFVIHEILNSYLKQNRFVVLFHSTQNFTHFSNVSLKFGVFLKQSKEKKQIISFDLMKLLSDCFREDQQQSKSESSSLVSSLIQSKDLRSFYQIIKQTVRDKGNEDVILIIDNITLFLSFGYSLECVLNFVHYCKVLMKDCNGCLLLCGYETSDEENQRFDALLCHLCDKLVIVQGLSTGHSKEVDGKISVTTKDGLWRNEETKTKLFRVEDKSVKLLPM